MRKGIAFILALIYLFSTSGVAIEAHYCMGKVVATHWYIQQPIVNVPANSCGKAKPMKRKCCHNEQRFYKSDDAHKNPEQLFTAAKVTSDEALMPVLFEWASPVVQSPIITKQQLYPPPDIGQLPLYIQYGVFRI
jgi:hypothetical protein